MVQIHSRQAMECSGHPSVGHKSRERSDWKISYVFHHEFRLLEHCEYPIKLKQSDVELCSGSMEIWTVGDNT